MELLESIRKINDMDLREFEKLSSSQKTSQILKGFKSYYSCQSKFNKAKSEDIKDRYFFETERQFSLAVNMLRRLSSAELIDFVEKVKARMLNAIEEQDKSKAIFNNIFYGTIIRQVSSISEDIADELLQLKIQMDDILEK